MKWDICVGNPKWLQGQALIWGTYIEAEPGAESGDRRELGVIVTLFERDLIHFLGIDNEFDRDDAKKRYDLRRQVDVSMIGGYQGPAYMIPVEGDVDEDESGRDMIFIGEYSNGAEVGLNASIGALRYLVDYVKQHGRFMEDPEETAADFTVDRGPTYIIDLATRLGGYVSRLSSPYGIDRDVQRALYEFVDGTECRHFVPSVMNLATLSLDEESYNQLSGMYVRLMVLSHVEQYEAAARVRDQLVQRTKAIAEHTPGLLLPARE